jgi:hypothetical protein
VAGKCLADTGFAIATQDTRVHNAFDDAACNISPALLLGQLVLTVVAAVILVFSFLFKNITKATDAGLYFILFGICAAFFTTFWSLGIVRLGEKLRAGIDGQCSRRHGMPFKSGDQGSKCV